MNNLELTKMITRSKWYLEHYLERANEYRNQGMEAAAITAQSLADREQDHLEDLKGLAVQQE